MNSMASLAFVFPLTPGKTEEWRAWGEDIQGVRRSEYEEHRHMTQQCSHLDQIREVTPSANGCEDCLKTGDTWLHLRLCLTCGHVGCCDSSKNKHATKHFHATNHPIIQSFEPGEDWGWCYIDQVMLEFA